MHFVSSLLYAELKCQYGYCGQLHTWLLFRHNLLESVILHRIQTWADKIELERTKFLRFSSLWVSARWLAHPSPKTATIASSWLLREMNRSSLILSLGSDQGSNTDENTSGSWVINQQLCCSGKFKRASNCLVCIVLCPLKRPGFF